MNDLKFAIAQVESRVGNIEYNYNQIIDIYHKNNSDRDLIIFPEMFLTGYPIEDLILHIGFQISINKYINNICNITKGLDCAILLGTPYINDIPLSKIYNAAILIHNGAVIGKTYKSKLPNYGVFDEKRTFASSESDHIPIKFKNLKLGVMICEDAWHIDVSERLKENDSDLLIAINASPFEITKQQKRLDIANLIVEKTGLPFIYVNMIGGQDSLIFDGGSFILNSKKQFILPPQTWRQNLFIIHSNTTLNYNHMNSNYGEEENIYWAIMIGIRDYVVKNNFRNVILGLSGGIDSALVATLAADALGPETTIFIFKRSFFNRCQSTFK
jgi:predicted amidohydrolase